jgi:hypothetical protein
MTKGASIGRKSQDVMVRNFVRGVLRLSQQAHSGMFQSIGVLAMQLEEDLGSVPTEDSRHSLQNSSLGSFHIYFHKVHSVEAKTIAQRI